MRHPGALRGRPGAGRGAGAAGGRAVVPEEWIAALTERTLVERMADELTAVFGGP